MKSFDGDGSTVDFDLDFTPITGSVEAFLNGASETAYTLSGARVTMTTAPALAQTLTVFYRRMP